jgi:hypothetical protein
VRWIHLAQDRVQWRAVVDTVMIVVFHKGRKISWPAERHVGPQKGFCSMKLVHSSRTCEQLKTAGRRKLEQDNYVDDYRLQSSFVGMKFFFTLWGGTKSLGTAATSGLLYKPQMIDEDGCGAIGGMKIGRGNRSTRRKPAPAPLCPPQIPHD